VEQYNRHLEKFHDYIEEKNKNLDIFKVENIDLDIAE
jgi:hypothetical protein